MPTNKRGALIISAIALIAFCALIFVVSAQAGDESGEMSLGFADRFASIFIPGYNEMSASDQLVWQKRLNLPIRKTAHALEYAVLGMLAFNFANQVQQAGLVGRRAASHAPSASGTPSSSPAQRAGLPSADLPSRRTALISWIFCALYAASDEIHQYFVPGREFHSYDIAIDAAGAAIGLLILFGVLLRAKRRHQGHNPR